jgi:hypothetical protein
MFKKQALFHGVNFSGLYRSLEMQWGIIIEPGIKSSTIKGGHTEAKVEVVKRELY